jgi:MFS superfamily sulfate permease-like transporter
VGPSRILVFGPDSALLPLFAAAVVPLAAGDAVRAIDLASAITIMAGILCLVAALARLGFLTDLLSGPIRIGYMNGIALIILAGQLPKLLGFAVPTNDVVGELQAQSTDHRRRRSSPRRDRRRQPGAIPCSVGRLRLPSPLFAVVVAGAS